jgi:hypothetical protein
MIEEYKKLASDAIGVQNACNLSGVVHAFSRAFETLWDRARESGQGTNWVNNHPISILFSTQIAFLSGTSVIGCEDQMKYEWAFICCKQISLEGGCDYDYSPDSLNSPSPSSV